MRKFRLIKEYPGSPKLPYKIQGDANGYITPTFHAKAEDIENNPEYWEEFDCVVKCESKYSDEDLIRTKECELEFLKGLVEIKQNKL